MSTNHTTNYQLSQWAKSDQVKMEDFNADNAKIDAAIKTVEQKADSLTAGKADASAVTALSQTVAAHTSTLSKKGNCQIYTASYTGNGRYGSGRPCSLSFPATPRVVIAMSANDIPIIMVNPSSQASWGVHSINVSWGSRGVSWYSVEGDAVQMNQASVIYYVVAFLELS